MTKRRALIIAVPMVVALLLLLGTGAGVWLSAGDDDSGGGDGGAAEAVVGGETEAPHMLAGYRLQRSASGAAAVAAVDELHGLAIEVDGGWLGEYEGGGAIWVARMEAEEEALELVDRMTAAIQDGTPFFTNLQRQDFGDLAVYSLEGGGQRHFYYSMGTQIVWVTTPAGDEGSFFHEALETVR